MSGLCPHGFESRRRRSYFTYRDGFMAEWSKALDSSSSLHLKAWVRIPLEPPFWIPTSRGPVAQWIARLTSDQAVAGSSPARVVFCTLLRGGLAQSVECVLCKHEAPGSKPGFSTILPELRQVGRVVKAVDSKSTGLRPRQFESGTCRSICLPL